MAKGETYEQFVDKFKPKKTTDDCYTPAAVMDVVNDYVERRYNVSRETFVRPFWPGGDYESEDYTGKIVVDNPPFSILAKILRFYQEHGVPFFLFCNGLTGIYHAKNTGITFVAVGADIEYENGAKVRTAFLTNMEPETAARTDVELTRALRALRVDKRKPKTELPPNWWTSSRLITAAGHGDAVTIPRDGVSFSPKRPDGKQIYGGALIYEELDAKAH